MIQPKIQFVTSSPLLLPLPEQLDKMAVDGSLVAFYKQLRKDHPINYGQMVHTAKSLKTLPEQIKKTAISYFRRQDNDSEQDSQSMSPNDNKNLLDEMRERIQQMDYQGAHDKSGLKKRWWTPDEDEKLKHLVEEFGARNWKRIAAFFDDRTDVQCLHRWQKVLNPKLVKGPWTKQEDDLVVKLVMEYGPKNWSFIAKNLPGRIGKQCRQRWHNHLNPDIRKERWTQQEDQAIIQAHKKVGNKWALIARWLPGRTDNAIKNHWNSTIKRRLRLAGTYSEDSQDGIAQRLFPTPQRPNISEWKAGSPDEQGRSSFDQNQEGRLILMMPFFERNVEMNSEQILECIFNLLKT